MFYPYKLVSIYIQIHLALKTFHLGCLSKRNFYIATSDFLFGKIMLKKLIHRSCTSGSLQQSIKIYLRSKKIKINLNKDAKVKTLKVI